VHKAGFANLHSSFSGAAKSFIYFYYSIPTSASCPEGQQYTTLIFSIYLCVHKNVIKPIKGAALSLCL
jgi:hypothetical protein